MFKLDHLELRVTNFPSALEFYRKLFGFTQFLEVSEDGGGSDRGFRQVDGLTLWIHGTEGTAVEPRRGSLDHFAFHCETRKQVDQAFEFCRSHAWKILSEPKAYPQYGNFYGFAFEGPDGLKLEFVTR